MLQGGLSLGSHIEDSGASLASCAVETSLCVQGPEEVGGEVLAVPLGLLGPGDAVLHGKELSTSPPPPLCFQMGEMVP